MKTRYWILLISLVLILALGASCWLFFAAPKADHVEIYSQGTLIYTLPLNIDKDLAIEIETGWNQVQIAQGKIAVVAASCPDKLCMHQGTRAGGGDIVCLPNRMVIHFTNNGGVDGVSG